MPTEVTGRRALAAAGCSLFFALAPGMVAGVVSLANAAFVRWHEEPTLCHRFGADYEVCRQAVPAWWPRRRPWVAGPPGEAA